QAIQAISIRTKLAPSVSISAAAVTREYPLNQYQEDRLKALTANKSIPDRLDTNRSVADLYFGISTGMRVF
ncbi:hypothetical protein JG688_00013490, partial [Phytophthora aleatoria]